MADHWDRASASRRFTGYDRPMSVNPATVDSLTEPELDALLGAAAWYAKYPE